VEVEAGQIEQVRAGDQGQELQPFPGHLLPKTIPSPGIDHRRPPYG
jgi:hypothetical protein